MTLTTRIKTLCCLFILWASAGATAASVETQRAQFKEAYALARSGHASVLKTHQATLNDYILWPDLVSGSYLGRLRKISDSDIQAHLGRFPDTSLNKTLRYRYIRSLAERGAWEPFLLVYDPFYADAGDTDLDCHAQHARLALGGDRTDVDRALSLWMVGKSQPKACDPLFRELNRRGVLTEALHDQRMQLALASASIDLARFLAGNAPASQGAWVERWQRMRSRPERELRSIGKIGRSDLRNKLYAYGIKRLARRDAEKAHQMLATTSADARLNKTDKDALALYIALRGARQRLPQANDWIDRLPSVSSDLAEWSVRAALAQDDWATVLDAIAEMNDELRAQDSWRYWQARALEALGRGAEAQPVYARLAGERSYYAFLAADRLGQTYRFAHESVPDQPVLQAALAANPKIVRARELYLVGLYGPARSEWDRSMQDHDAATRRQAALLADGWGWHSEAIKTLARSAGHNDLLRFYPTPYKEAFDETTRMADIARTWAYGVTRSESLFMSDVKSSAGAIGLMQLIPGTGRQTARHANLPYHGTRTLLDPNANIRLGVHYLGQMYSRFDDNQVLATAAYNAGPRRVKSWLPADSDQPADIWIETVPFTETRNYVKRVLFAATIFHWRLTGTEQRLAALMPPISANGPGKVASK